MRKFLLLAMAGLCMIIGMSGCKKAPINRDIEGMWILDEFTIRETDETVRCERLYYSITRMVTEVAEKQGKHGYGAYIGRTAYQNDETQLVLTDFKIRKSTGDSGEDAPTDKLKHFGINNPQKTVFDVISCDGKKMTLQSDYAILHLTKF